MEREDEQLGRPRRAARWRHDGEVLGSERGQTCVEQLGRP
jgi:hypothetical protein